MKEFDWVSDLKVRFGYGVTGNNDFDASYMANTLSATNTGCFLAEAGLMSMVRALT